jgi:hypothetical protein
MGRWVTPTGPFVVHDHTYPVRSKERDVLNRLDSLERTAKTYLGVSGSYLLRTDGDRLYAASGSVGGDSSALSGTINAKFSWLSGTIAGAIDELQPLDPTLTALAGLNSTTGLLEQTEADAFTKRPMGTGTNGSILTYSDGLSLFSTLTNSRDYPRLPLHYYSANTTNTQAPANTELIFNYYGKAGQSLSTITVQWYLGTAGSGLTWAEIGVAKGTPVAGSGATVDMIGWASIATQATGSTGVRTTQITLTTPAAAGDELYLMWGQVATVTAYAPRASSLADILQSGLILNATSSLRPSLMVPSMFIPVSTNRTMMTAMIYNS